MNDRKSRTTLYRMYSATLDEAAESGPHNAALFLAFSQISGVEAGGKPTCGISWSKSADEADLKADFPAVSARAWSRSRIFRAN